VPQKKKARYDEKAFSFWYFLFDGPAPRDQVKEKLQNRLVKLMGSKSKQSKLLLEARKKVLEDWRERSAK
jgi:hypothetical protein